MLNKIAVVDKDEMFLTRISKYLENKNFKVHTYNTIKDYIKEMKINDYSVCFINDTFKTKEKSKDNVLIVYDEPKDTYITKDNYIYKYQNVKNYITKIYEMINNASYRSNDTLISFETNNKKTYNYKNILIYNVSKNDYTDKYIDKLIKEYTPNNKAFIWDFDMFSNDVESEGMDLNVASISKNILSNASFFEKLKAINKNIYTFSSLKNPFDFLEFKPNDYVDINNKLLTLEFDLFFIKLFGNLDSLSNEIIKQSDIVILFYDSKDEIKKDKIKNYISVMSDKRILDSNIVECKISYNDKKDINYISELTKMLC